MTSYVKPMRAVAPPSLDAIRFPKYASIKYDGIRALIVRNAVQSKSGKLIPNKHIQKCLAPLAGRGFDGELVVYDDEGKLLPFNETSSAVMSVDGEPNFVYVVFDIHNSSRSYENRYTDLCQQVACLKGSVSQLELAGHTLVRNMTQLLELEKNLLLTGHEGVILREPVHWYKHGSSTMRDQEMLKLKRTINENGDVVDYLEDEGRVVGFDETSLWYADQSTSAEHKIGGDCLGQLYLELRDEVQLKVGSGFTHEQRTLLWKQRDKLIGKIVKFKYFKYGSVDKPRHPVFLGFRDPIDLYLMDTDPFGLAIC